MALLRQRIHRLTECIADFCALEELTNRQAARYQLRYLAARRSGADLDADQYVRTRREYGDAAASLPLGIDRSYHRWNAAHASYFTYRTLDAEDRTGPAAAATSAFREFSSVITGMYAAEAQARDRILGSTVPVEPRRYDLPPPTTHALNAPRLVKLYDCLDRLGSASGDPERCYRRFARAFVRVAPNLSRDQRAFLYLTMRNHLVYQQKQGRPLPPTLLARWPEVLCLRGAYADYAPLPPLFVLDEFNLYLLGYADSSALAVLRHLLDLLPAGDDREYVELEAMVAYHFHLEEEEKAYRYILRLLRRPRHSDWRIHLRRLSFRLRSAMVCYLQSRHENDLDEIESSLSVFVRYYYRLGAKKPTPNAQTLDFVNNFIVVCRRINTYLQRKTYSHKSIAELEHLLDSKRRGVHAEAWLRRYIARLP
jgi:hypothetical protein